MVSLWDALVSVHSKSKVHPELLATDGKNDICTFLLLCVMFHLWSSLQVTDWGFIKGLAVFETLH